jgi:hypothetical protein
MLMGCGITFLYSPSLLFLSQWFGKGRNLAEGVSAADSGVDGDVFRLPQLALDMKLSKQLLDTVDSVLSRAQATDLIGFLNIGTAIG